jgi:hypothetical protein
VKEREREQLKGKYFITIAIVFMNACRLNEKKYILFAFKKI